MAAGQCGEGQKRATDAGVLQRHDSRSTRGGRRPCAVPLAWLPGLNESRTGHTESKIWELHISWKRQIGSKTCTKMKREMRRGWPV
jgi:hypothetical protein